MAIITRKASGTLLKNIPVGTDLMIYSEVAGKRVYMTWTTFTAYLDTLTAANAAVVLNTAKVGITAGQAADIVANNAKISYTDAAVVAAEEHGGEILTPPTHLASRGSLAVLKDSSGALLAILQARGGDPADREPSTNDFLWDELWTSDVARSSRFYQAVAGYETEDRAFGDAGDTYHLLKSGGSPRAGIQPNPFGDVPPVWVNYLRVEDPAAITAKVEAIGGEILVAAQARKIGGYAAMIAGPSGAGIALQTWPLNQEEN